EHLGEVAGVEVEHVARGALGDQHADLVAGEAARLGLLVGLEPRGKLETRERAHASTAGVIWLACQRPLRWSPSMSAIRAGTLSSGGGRSEMSSPGNA